MSALFEGLFEASAEAASKAAEESTKRAGAKDAALVRAVMKNKLKKEEAFNKKLINITKKAKKFAVKGFFHPMRMATLGLKKSAGWFTEKLPVASAALGGMGSQLAGILGIFEAIGVFAPILDVVKDLIGLFAGRLIEKLMPSFQKIIDILLSDEVMTLIGDLAGLFAELLEPLLEMAVTILPPLLGIIIPIVKIALTPLKIILELLSPLLEGLAPIFEALETPLKVVSGFTDTVGGVFSGIGDGIKKLFGIKDEIDKKAMTEEEAAALKAMTTEDIAVAGRRYDILRPGSGVTVNVQGSIIGDRALDEITEGVRLDQILGGR